MPFSEETQPHEIKMVVIKGKEKKLNKPAKAHGMTAKAKKILRRPQDCQPIPTVCV